MRWLIRIALFFGAAAVVVVLIGLALSKDYRVERRLVIEAPPRAVHHHVADLRHWAAWEPWRDADGSMTITLGEQTTGVGASQSWQDDTGGGSLRFTAVDPEDGVAYHLVFGQDDAMEADARIAYRPVEEGTEVVWSMTGNLEDPIFGGYMALMMDGLVGPMFERGLEDLAAAVAAYPGPPPPAEAPLQPGDSLPPLRLRDPEGEIVALDQVVAERPSVLVFYRGGWCPYCNTHLAEMAQHYDRILRAGWQIIGISPDRPRELAATITEQDLPYRLLSDAEAVAIQAVGLAFRVDETTREAYREHGIDLEAASGYDHYRLPHPAVYLVDRDGTIRFAHHDRDYRKRLDIEAVMAAIEGASP